MPVPAETSRDNSEESLDWEQRANMARMAYSAVLEITIESILMILSCQYVFIRKPMDSIILDPEGFLTPGISTTKGATSVPTILKSAEKPGLANYR
jgi:hypothetical protein